MDRREFIKSAMAALAATSLPLSLGNKPVIYYVDLSIASLSIPRAVIWGNPQQYAIIELAPSEIIGKPLELKDDLFLEKIKKATGLAEFKLEPHPWQAEMEEKMAKLDEELSREEEV